MTGSFAPHHVVVIDDHHEIRSLLDELLSAEGFRVSALPLHELGVEFLAALGPDLIIVDPHGASGIANWQPVEAIRAHPALRPVPLIVCSASITHGAPARLAPADPVRAIAKPFDLQPLLRMVETMTMPTGAHLGPGADRSQPVA